MSAATRSAWLPRPAAMTAAILAGGLGTRLRPAGLDRPKVLAPVGGRPFVTWILDWLARSGVERVVLCTGKVYVDMITSEEYQKAVGVAVVRVEDLYPFPSDHVAKVLARYGKAKEVVWTQEEPENRGAAPSVMPRLQALVKQGVQLRYVGRPARASHAEGSSGDHKIEQSRIVREALLDTGLITTAAGMVKHVR